MIRAEQVSKRFGDTVALDNVSFEAQPGRVTALLGPNGSGKTTLIRTVLGLTQPDAGVATIRGCSYSEIPNPLLAVGACLDTEGAHPSRTGYQHLRILTLASGIPRSRIREVLQLVGLETAANRRVKGYSLGMKQRLGIASAVLGNPGVLVLDEPQTGLDIDGIAWLRDFLTQAKQTQKTILLASHSLQEIEKLADTVIFLHRGRVRAEEDLNAILNAYPTLEEAYTDICSAR